MHPSGVAKSGKGGKVTSAGWQVTLCDPIWHVISRSGVVISITNFYIRVYFYRARQLKMFAFIDAPVTSNEELILQLIASLHHVHKYSTIFTQKHTDFCNETDFPNFATSLRVCQYVLDFAVKHVYFASIKFSRCKFHGISHQYKETNCVIM